MNKNAVYVENQPVHSIISLVVINDLNIDEKIHEALDNLGKISDLFFIFSDKNKGDIMIPTFTRLYSGCSYICGTGTFSESLYMAFRYCTNIFKKHSAFIITDTSRLGLIDINESLREKIINITLSDIKNPILEKVRLSTDELREIYIKRENLIDKVLGRQNEWIRSFSTHRSNSKLLYFKEATVNYLLTLLKEGQIKYFIEEDISYFLTSSLVRNGLEIIDQSIEKIKFKDNGEVQTEGEK